MMFGMQFFANFETKLLLILLKSIDDEILDFIWIQNAPPQIFFLYEENKRKFCFKIAKKIHTKHHQIGHKLWKLFDLMMFGMQFFANLKTKLCLFSSKGVV